MSTPKPVAGGAETHSLRCGRIETEALMPPRRHPSPRLLADYAAGRCAPGAAMLIVAHARACIACQGRIPPAAWAMARADDHGDAQWRVLRPGLALARIIGAGGLGEGVYRLRAAAGLAVAFVEELEVAELLVTDGGFYAEGRAFAAGDFLALAQAPIGPAVTDAAAGCACLVTIDDASARPWFIEP